MTVPVRTTPRADNDALAITDWWRENRLAAPYLFEEELTAALRLLSEQPDIGAQFQRRGALNLRRLLLQRMRYFVYYEHDESGVLVHAVWSAVRGRPPRLLR